MIDKQQPDQNEIIEFYGGVLGVLVPFLIFIGGVITVALSGAPDEKGFWPILLLAIGVGMLLAKDKTAYSKMLVRGMSQQIVMIMIMAWMLASIIGVLMSSTGLIESLTWLISELNLGPSGFVVSSFIICSIISLSTGSSFATILICGPILYPAGGLLGSHLALLAGSIIAGATLGDFSAPISDTTISSALSQDADLGKTVRSRLKYIIPVAIISLITFFALSNMITGNTSQVDSLEPGSPLGLVMILVPVLIIYLFATGRHLVHGLLFGLLFGVAMALIVGLLPTEELFSLDLENFSARSFVIDGINGAIGISVFTILLLGLIESFKASGLIDQLVAFTASRVNSGNQAEGWIGAAVTGAVLLTTHSIVAILAVSQFSNETGKRFSLSPVRRANILSLIVCIFPFVLPYFIPVVLMASTTQSGSEYGIESVAPIQIGMFNFVAIGLAIMTLLTLFFGYGRNKDQNT